MKISKFLSSLKAPLIAVTFVIATTVVAQYYAETKTLIQGVDTPTLFKLMGAKPNFVRVGEGNVAYSVLSIPDKANFKIQSDVTIGVFPSVEAAKRNFAGSISRPVGPAKLETKKPGDDFIYWTGQGISVTGKMLPIGGNCLLRRKNVVLNFSYQGSPSEGVEMARRIDTALQESDQLAPKGQIVPVPKVSLSIPPVISLVSHSKIEFRSENNISIRVAGNRVPNGNSDLLQSQGRVSPFTNNLENGQVSIPIYMATEDNVVFTQNVEVKVVSPEEYEASRPMHDWELPENILYFLDNPDKKWEKLSISEREWFKTDTGMLGYVKEEEKREALRGQARSEWQKALKAEWIPEPELITVATNFEPPAPPQYVAHASVSRENTKVVYMGSLGEELWLYIEQPAPTDKAIQVLKAEDVILPGVLTAMQGANNDLGVSFLSRNFVRYRALSYKGPYERVNILFFRIWLSPDQTGSFHYPVGKLGSLPLPK